MALSWGGGGVDVKGVEVAVERTVAYVRGEDVSVSILELREAIWELSSEIGELVDDGCWTRVEIILRIECQVGRGTEHCFALLVFGRGISWMSLCKALRDAPSGADCDGGGSDARAILSLVSAL